MIIWLSLLVAIIGGLVFYLSAPPPAPAAGPAPASRYAERKELGRLAFACGLLAFLLQAGPYFLSLTAHLYPRP
jgi:hypothetical protein